jgi:hypothetical protein
LIELSTRSLSLLFRAKESPDISQQNYHISIESDIQDEEQLEHEYHRQKSKQSCKQYVVIEQWIIVSNDNSDIDARNFQSRKKERQDA